MCEGKLSVLVCVCASTQSQELGFSGVEIGSHIRNGEGEDWNLDHPELQCVFAVSHVVQPHTLTPSHPHTLTCRQPRS